jgi:hypothetical protein
MLSTQDAELVERSLGLSCNFARIVQGADTFWQTRSKESRHL